MGLWLRQSTAVTVNIGPFIDDTDGKTAETGLTEHPADILLAKNGGNFGAKNEASNLTHDNLGWYHCPIDATDTNTLGILQLHCHEAGFLPVFHEYMVVEEQVWDSFFGADKLDVNTAELANIDFGATMKASINTEVDSALNTAIPANVANSVNDILLDQLAPRLPGAGTISVLDAAAVNTEVDTALNTAIPAVNTATSVNDILLDVLTLAAVNAEVDTALNTAIPAVNTATSVNDILLDVVTMANINIEVDNALNTAIPAVNTATSINDVLLDVLTIPTINATVDTALTDIDLDHLVKTDIGAGKPTVGTLMDKVMNKAAGQTFDPATDSLEAIVDVDLTPTLADTNELQADWANGGRLDLLIDLILGDTNELQTDWVNGGRLDLLIDLILGDTNELQTDWTNGGRLDLLVDSIISKVDAVDDYVDTEVGAIKAVTDTLSLAAIADAVHDEAVEGAYTLRQMARLLLAACVGKLSGAGTGTLTFRDVNDTANRIVATVDVTNNRTGVVLTV